MEHIYAYFMPNDPTHCSFFIMGHWSFYNFLIEWFCHLWLQKEGSTLHLAYYVHAKLILVAMSSIQIAIKPITIAT